MKSKRGVEPEARKCAWCGAVEPEESWVDAFDSVWMSRDWWLNTLGEPFCCPKHRRYSGRVPPGRGTLRALENGRIGQQRGIASEKQVLLICRSMPDVSFARLSTKKEDRVGIDIVVFIGVDPLYLQVKSSHGGMKRWRKRKNIGLVLAGDRCDEAVRRSIKEQLIKLQRRKVAKNECESKY